MPPTVAQLVDRPLHAGSLQGAALIGEAAGGARLTVRLGLWLDPSGRVVQARFRATTCASLIAYAEAACALAEREARPAPPMAERLRAEVAGVHPLHRDRAELVALALRRALAERPQPPPQPPPGGPP